MGFANERTGTRTQVRGMPKSHPPVFCGSLSLCSTTEPLAGGTTPPRKKRR